MQYFPRRLLAALGVAALLAIGTVTGSDSKAGLGYTQPEANGHRKDIQLSVQSLPEYPQDLQFAIPPLTEQAPNPGYSAAQIAQSSAQPPDQETYCLRTLSRITIRPLEHFTIRDVFDETLKDAVLFTLDSITPAGNYHHYVFTAKNLTLKNPDIKKTGNKFSITGELDGVNVAYSIELPHRGSESVTAVFGPERCFPGSKKESTGI